MATPETRKARAALAADGGLFTAAAFAVALGVALAAGTGSHASNVAAGIGLIVAIALGPLVVWLLHGRHAGRAATVAALLGFVAGGAAALALLLPAGIAMQAGRAAGIFSTTEDASSVVGLVAAAIVAAALLALCTWAGATAAHDLLSGHRRHARLDAGRLAATAVCVAGVVIMLTRVAAGSEANAGMNAALVLAGPLLLGAAAVTVADLVLAHDRRRTGHTGWSEPAATARGDPQ